MELTALPPMTNDGRELPRFTIDGREVWALQVKSVRLSTPPQIAFEDPGFGPFNVTTLFVTGWKPKQGDWFTISQGGICRIVKKDEFNLKAGLMVDA